MSKLVQVTALAAFVSGGREIFPGLAQVPESAVKKLTAKGLIEPLPGGSIEAEVSVQSGEEADQLRAQLDQQQQQFDAAYDALREDRDELFAEIEQLKSQLGGKAVIDFADALHEEFSSAEAATVLGSEYSAPTAILDAPQKTLNKLPGFGDAKVKQLKALAARFEG